MHLRSFFLLGLASLSLVGCSASPSEESLEESEGASTSTPTAAFDETVTRFSPTEVIALTRYKADPATLAGFKREIEALHAAGELADSYADDLARLKADVEEGAFDFDAVPPTDPLRKDLTEEERMAAHLYTKDSIYIPVNNALRTAARLCKEAHPRPCPALAFDLLRPFKNTIKATASALNKLPRHDGTLLRGTKAAHLSSYLPGSTVVEPVFLSHTANSSIPEPFRSTGTMKTVVKGCAHIWRLSKSPSEGEVLCPPGTRYKVTSRKTEGQNVFVEAERVD